MNSYQQFQLLGLKQLAIQDGLELLRQAQFDLNEAKRNADSWAFVAIMANVAIIPLNCIINAFELKAAKTGYQVLVRMLYNQFGKSGSRLQGTAKPVLSSLKQAITQELKRQALTDYIPGVNILVGLAEDSIAAVQVSQQVSLGENEMNAQVRRMAQSVAAASRQLQELGTKRAELLSRMQRISVTA